MMPFRSFVQYNADRFMELKIVILYWTWAYITVKNVQRVRNWDVINVL